MGNSLNVPEMAKEYCFFQNPNVNMAYAEVNGMRQSMEDKIIYTHLYKDWYMYGVLDGHGGVICAELVQKELPLLFKKAFESNENIPSDNELSQICVTFDKTMNSKCTSGTTAAIVLLDLKTRHTVSLNIGDSSIFYFNEFDKMIFEAIEHTPSNDNERKRIEASGISVVNNRVGGRLAVSRAFGDCEYKQKNDDYEKLPVIAIPSIVHHNLDDNSHIYITCDGLYEKSFTKHNIHNEVGVRLNKLLNHEQKGKLYECVLAKVMCEVIDNIVDDGSMDNISLMYINLDSKNQNINHYTQVYPGVININEEAVKERIRMSYIYDINTEQHTLLRIYNLEKMIADCKNIKPISLDALDYYGYIPGTHIADKYTYAQKELTELNKQNTNNMVKFTQSFSPLSTPPSTPPSTPSSAISSLNIQKDFTTTSSDGLDVNCMTDKHCELNKNSGLDENSGMEWNDTEVFMETPENSTDE